MQSRYGIVTPLFVRTQPKLDQFARAEVMIVIANIDASEQRLQ